MTILVRLVYASHATFLSPPDMATMPPEVAEILRQSQRNNKQAKISGVLYFADNYFLQCLEGSESAVLDLLDTLMQDPRHKDLKVSYCKRIRRRYFKGWSMQYVPVNQAVIDLIQSRGYQRFDPCAFDEADINALIDYFSRLKEPSSYARQVQEMWLGWRQKLARVFDFQR